MANLKAAGFCSAVGNVRAWPSAKEGVQTLPATATANTAATPAAAPSSTGVLPTVAADTTAAQSMASSSPSSLAYRGLAPDVFVGLPCLPMSSCRESADRVWPVHEHCDSHGRVPSNDAVGFA
jgi:hypothetical protein